MTRKFHWQAVLAALAFFCAVLLPWYAQAQTRQIRNQADYSFTDASSGQTINGNSNPIVYQLGGASLVDPAGRITGCAGELLANYSGFTVAQFDPNPADPSGTERGALVQMNPTEIPDAPGNGVPLGLAPNGQNLNPFPLSNADQGLYNFLLDPARGQLDAGRTYILVVTPPANTLFAQRRVRVVLGARTGATIAFTATALDGRPVELTGGAQTVNGTINVNVQQAGLVLSVFNLPVDICQSQEIQIQKTADRAAAEPGDVVIYRLNVRNLSSSAISNLVLNDTLPIGVQYVDGSVRAEINGTAVPIAITVNSRLLTFNLGVPFPAATSPTQTPVLNVAYAAVLTPDSVRGDGQNSATVQGQRADNQLPVRDGPASQRIQIRPGILSDCGTLVGRVFVDKNFDGEQQPGEPGVPNAVIFMDDGNRIITDANGLFSVANVLSGTRTAAIDLSSLPGYTLAPNLYFIERNSQSRLIRLAPGGRARGNFAVTPTFQEEKP